MRDKDVVAEGLQWKWLVQTASLQMMRLQRLTDDEGGYLTMSAK